MEITKLLEEWNEQLAPFTIEDKISFIINKIKDKKVFSTSFGIEDQMLTHLLAPYHDQIEAFTLDTGRQFEETYQVFQSTQIQYDPFKIKVYFPNEEDIQKYSFEKGINAFYTSIENRKECCYIRKINPLQRALKGYALWFTGLRAEQSPNRKKIQFLEWNENYQLIKFNPLLNFTLKEVEEFIEKNNIPINSLYKKGFVSIGCAPCTRAIQEGEDFRAGRWWWENGKKECGLHIPQEKNN